MLRLSCRTDPRYVEVALADLDRLLVDHAHCEHKAAVTALSFVSKYPDDPRLVTALAALARDEAAHFARMAELCTRRGLDLGHPDKDPYVQRLLAAVRPGVVEQRVDRLLVCALIEGRSCERLQLLAAGLAARAADPELVTLYDELWREEASHHALFIELAERSWQRAGKPEARAVIAARLAELADIEAAIVQALPLRAAIH
jgi:tRNA 2-(methylsulfanyl)-N6-isopentenyladenosine37 hydroxylase